MKQIILFGAGGIGKKALQYFGSRNVYCFCDNNPEKYANQLRFGKKVIGFKELESIHMHYDVYIAANRTFATQIREQLLSAGIEPRNFFEALSLADFDPDPSWEKLKAIYQGKRCFIIGNAPSLRADDLEKIHTSGDISFGQALIWKIFDQTAWRPTYYSYINVYDAGKYIHNINEIEAEALFVGCKNGDILRNETYVELENRKTKDLYLIHNIPAPYVDSLPRVSFEPERATYGYGSSLVSVIGIAVYMGFQEIILLGFENSIGIGGMLDCHFYHSEPEEAALCIERGVDLGLYRKLIDNTTHLVAHMAKERGVKILNATRGGFVEAFERVDFDKLFQV